MFLIFIYQVLAIEFNYTKTYLVSNSKFSNLFINLASDNVHFIISPEKKTRISFEYSAEKNGAIVKANGISICPSKNEIKLCKKDESPKLIRMKEKDGGFRFKTATTKVFEIKKCFGVTDNRLTFTDCLSETPDKIWYFKDFDSQVQNNYPFPQQGPNQNGKFMYSGNSDSSDQNYNQSSAENFNRSIAQTNPICNRPQQEMIFQPPQPGSIYPYLTCMPEYPEAKLNSQQLPLPNNPVSIPSGAFFCVPPKPYQQPTVAVPQLKKEKKIDLPLPTVVPVPEPVGKNFNQSKINNCLPILSSQPPSPLTVPTQPTNMVYSNNPIITPSKQDCDFKTSLDMSNNSISSGNCLNYNDFSCDTLKSF